MYYETFTSFIELFVWHSFWRIFTNGTITFRAKNSILLMSRMEIRQKYCRMLMRWIL